MRYIHVVYQYIKILIVAAGGRARGREVKRERAYRVTAAAAQPSSSPVSMATTYKAVVIGCSRMGAFIDNVRPSFPRDLVLPLPSVTTPAQAGG